MMQTGTRIKLCGLTRPEDVEVANQVRPDYVGFVFFKKSRRNVEPEQAVALRRMLHPQIQAVGVFVNEDPDQVADLLEQGIIQIPQLHGQEDEAYMKTLRQRIPEGTQIFQAFRIDSKEDVERARASTADMILLDSGDGGTGQAFDWSLIQELERPFLLAGGLTVENVAEAVSTCRPYGVDVSSGIETEKRKDPEKMRAFVEQVRNADGI